VGAFGLPLNPTGVTMRFSHIMICLALTLASASCALDQTPVPIPPGSWSLDVCTGVSWGGCGANLIRVYPNEAECYKSLDAMRADNQTIAESGLKRSNVATCGPAQPGDLGQ
jgi:hypothetical protein